MLQWETIRFDKCSEILWSVIQAKVEKLQKSICGVVYSDVPPPEEIKLREDLRISYYGKEVSSNNLQVHLLLVNGPETLDHWNLPDLAEALASLLAFSFRTRLTASRHWCSLDSDGRLSRPVDLFLRLSSASAGPLAVHPISIEGIYSRIKTVNRVVGELTGLSMKDFRRITRSLHLYQLSLITYPMDVGLAYSLLVSSIDNISCKASGSNNKKRFISFIKRYLPESFWTKPDSKAWEEDRWLDSITPWKYSIVDDYKERYAKEGENALLSLKGILSDSAIERLRGACKGTTKLTTQEQKMYDHVLHHWYLYRIDMKLTQKELPDILKRIHEDVRSAFFHGGRSPPDSAVDRYETAPMKPVIKADGTVMWRRDIPSFHTFERITHDTLLAYILSQG